MTLASKPSRSQPARPGGEGLLKTGGGQASTAPEAAGDELLRTKARLEHLLNATPAVLFTAAPRRYPAITFVGDNIAAQFGHAGGDIVGAPDFWTRYVHPEDSARVLAAIASLRPGRTAALECRLLHRDGSHRHVSMEIRRVRGKNGAPVELAGFWLDITERKRLDAALRATIECGEALVHATSEPELLESICQVIVRMGDYLMAWVGFPAPGPAKRVVPVARAGAGVDYVDKAKITWAADEPRGQGPIGRALRTHRPVTCANFRDDPRFAPWRREALRRGYASIIALPLLWRGECLGSLNIYSGQTGAFHGEAARLLANLAGDIAYGLVALRTRAEQERLQREILEISEREQRRIAQDLHDSLCQQILGAGCVAGAIQRRLSQRDDPEARAVGRLAESLNTAASDARALAHGIHPIGPGPGALEKALGEFAAFTARMFNIKCRFRCPRPVRLPQQGAATNLYRIAQEAVGNAIKHGAATHVTIVLRQPPRGRLMLEIRDNGSGLPAGPLDPRGMGLQIMRHRAANCGGSVAIRNARPRGTLVRCEVPRKPEWQAGK